MGCIYFICPNRAVRDTLEWVTKNLSANIVVREGTPDQWTSLRREAERLEADVIVCKWIGDPDWSEAGISIPLVPLRATGYDVVKAVVHAHRLDPSVGYTGFPEVYAWVEKAGAMLNIGIRKVPLVSRGQIRGSVLDLAAQGCRVILGGTEVCVTAESIGLNSALITSGEESIRQAVAEALRVQQVRRAESERAGWLRAVLLSVDSGILACDREGKVRVSNVAAARLLSCTTDEIIGSDVSHLLPGFNVHSVLERGMSERVSLMSVGGIEVVVKSSPIIADNEVFGAIASLEDCGTIRSIEEKIRRQTARKGYVAKYTFKDIVACSAAMQRVIATAREYARVDSTVMIEGHTGTGKEILAQSIHAESHRRGRPFVAVNCAALPETLLESELFGYEPGAFTGASPSGKQGLFEIAHTGTVFLDEIGEMSRHLQARLLRVLQEKEVQRIGGSRIIPLDIRLISATNRNLADMVRLGEFREDLYYRLDVLNVRIPPLKERREDIPVLAKDLLVKIADRLGRVSPRLTPKAVDSLVAYDWPGTIRQLQNFLEQLVVLFSGMTVSDAEIDDLMNTRIRLAGARVSASDDTDSPGLKDVEMEAIIRALEDNGGQVAKAAKALGISRTTLWRRLRGRR